VVLGGLVDEEEDDEEVLEAEDEVDEALDEVDDEEAEDEDGPVLSCLIRSAARSDYYKLNHVTSRRGLTRP
jgi:hypothetical protein